jgi:uncharacterized protein YukE
MAVPISLPEVPGDPAGMRALAGALKGDARDLEGVASGLSTAVGSMTFDGPAADRFREGAQDTKTSLAQASSSLGDLATLLETKADEVEAAQKARLQALHNMQREMAQDGIHAVIVQ